MRVLTLLTSRRKVQISLTVPHKCALPAARSRVIAGLRYGASERPFKKLANLLSGRVPTAPLSF